MTEVVYGKIEKLVVHLAVKMELDEMIRERLTPGGTIPLYWCGGVLFGFSNLPMTGKVIEEYLHGTLHWAEVHYSEMKTYREVEELIDEHYPGPMKVRIIDTSRSPLHSEFVKWVKKMKKQK